MKIAVTGKIASGKSLVLSFFAAAGFKTFSADKIAHGFLSVHSPVYKKIIKTFGSAVKTPSGRISRKKLGRLVFANAGKMRALEKILHPEIKKSLLEKMKGGGNIAVENPLLFRMDMKGCFDKIVLVDCSSQKISENIKQKYGAERQAGLILKYQHRNLKLPRRPDFIISNTAGIRELRDKTRAAAKALVSVNSDE